MSNRNLLSVTIGIVLLASCGDTGGPDTRIRNVDTFLARLCSLAAECPGITATQANIDACPAGLRAKLSQNQLTALGRITGYTETRQNCIVECAGTQICGRFSGSLSFISDSDVVETFTACEQQCQ